MRARANTHKDTHTWVCGTHGLDKWDSEHSLPPMDAGQGLGKPSLGCRRPKLGFSDSQAPSRSWKTTQGSWERSVGGSTRPKMRPVPGKWELRLNSWEKVLSLAGGCVEVQQGLCGRLGLQLCSQRPSLCFPQWFSIEETVLSSELFTDCSSW